MAIERLQKDLVGRVIGRKTLAVNGSEFRG
jgi:hypothetical protein